MEKKMWEKSSVTIWNRKAVRLISTMGVLLVICGLRFQDVIWGRLVRRGVIKQDSSNPARDDVLDLEFALSGAMEPMGLQQTASKPGKVLADDSMGGQPVSVTLQIDGLPREIKGDANGVFPPVTVRAHQRVHVRVSYPEGLPGEIVQVQTQDGGTLDKDASAQVMPLNAERVVAFWFESSGNEGTHRVTVRRGFDEKTLDFWVGRMPTLHLVR